MFAALVVEYRELFDAYIASHLHPHDIVRAATVCRQLCALRTHPAYAHARAFAQVGGALRVPYSIARGDMYYEYRRRYRIINDNSQISLRGVRVTYTHMRYYEPYHPRLRESVINVDRIDDVYLTTIIHAEDTTIYTGRKDDAFDHLQLLWKFRLVAFNDLARNFRLMCNIAKRLGFTDHVSLALTCKTQRNFMRDLCGLPVLWTLPDDEQWSQI